MVGEPVGFLLVESAGADDLDRASAGTRWTNEQLLFPMVFGFMVVVRLLPLVRLFGRLPPAVGRVHARLLNPRPRRFTRSTIAARARRLWCSTGAA